MIDGVYQKRGILIGILILISLSNSKSIQTTTQNGSVSVELAIFNFSYTWGYCNVGEGHSDFYSPWKFTMGLVNNRTTRILLEEVNVTFVEKGNECITFQSKLVINEDEGLPLTLYPSHYWTRNITCPYATTIGVRIQIKVDSVIINYGEVISYSRVQDTYMVWPNWTKYKYYTETTNLISNDYGGMIIGLLILVPLIRKKNRILGKRKEDVWSR